MANKYEKIFSEAQYWAKQAGLRIETKGFGKSLTYHLINGAGKVIFSGSSLFGLLDAAYTENPYYEATKEEQNEKPEKMILTSKAEAIEFLEEALVALLPISEKDFLIAILDHPFCDWGLARSVYRKKRFQEKPYEQDR